jgi:hypothetical protein
VSKARDLFEPFLHQLGYRLAHVQRRMLPIAMHLLQKDGQFLNGHDLFLKRVGAAYHAFIDEFEKCCRWGAGLTRAGPAPGADAAPAARRLLASRACGSASPALLRLLVC